MTGDLLKFAEEAVEFARKSGAGEVAARVERRRDVELNWRDGKVETTKEATTRSLTVELYVDGRYGSMSTREESVRVTSNGFRGERVGTQFWAGGNVSVSDPDGRKPSDYFYAGSRVAVTLPEAQLIGRTAAERTLSRVGSQKPATASLAMAVENRAAGRRCRFNSRSSGVVTAPRARAMPPPRQDITMLVGANGSSPVCAELRIVGGSAIDP